MSIYSIYDKTKDEIHWKFDATDALLQVGSEYWPFIQVKWTFEDAIVNSIIDYDANNQTLIVPANAFRENAKYQVKVTWSN